MKGSWDCCFRNRIYRMWGLIGAESLEISDKGEDDILGLIGNERHEWWKYKIISPLCF